MRVAIFSLTGFANEILPALDRIGITPVIFVTRDEPGPFPHYRLPDARLVAEQLSIPYGVSEADEEKAIGADLLLVATYHRKVSATIYENTKHAINLHPSLLPKFPGRDPFTAVLESGMEKQTGITAHRLTDKMDNGEVCGQWVQPIMPNETSGSLREKLSYVSARAAVELVQRIRAGATFS